MSSAVATTTTDSAARPSRAGRARRREHVALAQDVEPRSGERLKTSTSRPAASRPSAISVPAMPAPTTSSATTRVPGRSGQRQRPHHAMTPQAIGSTKMPSLFASGAGSGRSAGPRPQPATRNNELPQSRMSVTLTCSPGAQPLPPTASGRRLGCDHAGDDLVAEVVPNGTDACSSRESERHTPTTDSTMTAQAWRPFHGATRATAARSPPSVGTDRTYGRPSTPEAVGSGNVRHPACEVGRSSRCSPTPSVRSTMILQHSETLACFAEHPNDRGEALASDTQPRSQFRRTYRAPRWRMPLRLSEMRAARATMASKPTIQSVAVSARTCPPSCDTPQTLARRTAEVGPGALDADRRTGNRPKRLTTPACAYVRVACSARRAGPSRGTHNTAASTGAPAPAARTRPARSGPATWSLAPR